MDSICLASLACLPTPSPNALTKAAFFFSSEFDLLASSALATPADLRTPFFASLLATPTALAAGTDLIEWPAHLPLPTQESTDSCSSTSSSSASYAAEPLVAASSASAITARGFFDFDGLLDDSVSEASSDDAHSSGAGMSLVAIPEISGGLAARRRAAKQQRDPSAPAPKRKRCPIMARKNRLDRKIRFQGMLKHSDAVAEDNRKLRNEALALKARMAQLKAQMRLHRAAGLIQF